jgi:cell division septation protein DedD
MEGMSSWIDENYSAASAEKNVSYRFLCLCTAFVSVWMFFLGITVGRNTCPIRFDTEPIMSQLTQLIESDVKQQQEYAQTVNSQDKKPEINILESLKNANVDLIPHAQKKKQPPDNLENPETELITKRSTKKRTIGHFSLSSEKKTTDLSDCVTLQTAALKNPHAAVEMAKKLKSMGFPAYTASINLPQKGLWHRVRVGTFSSVQKARQMKDCLLQKNIDSIIVPFVRGDDYNFANAKDQIVNPES